MEFVIDRIFFCVKGLFFGVILKVNMLLFMFYWILRVFLVGRMLEFKFRFKIEGVLVEIGIVFRIFFWLYNYFVNWNLFFDSKVYRFFFNLIVILVDFIDFK